MTKRSKWTYEFTENNHYKCLYCGRTMEKPWPHQCNTGCRKHKMKYISDLTTLKDLKERADKHCQYMSIFYDDYDGYPSGILSAISSGFVAGGESQFIKDSNFIEKHYCDVCEKKESCDKPCKMKRNFVKLFRGIEL